MRIWVKQRKKQMNTRKLQLPANKCSLTAEYIAECFVVSLLISWRNQQDLRRMMSMQSVLFFGLYCKLILWMLSFFVLTIKYCNQGSMWEKKKCRYAPLPFPSLPSFPVPSPPSSFPPLPAPSLPCLPLPLEVGPLNPARRSGGVQ